MPRDHLSVSLNHKKSHHKDPPLALSMILLPNNRLKLAAACFISLVLIGTLGYHLIEHWDLLASIFMTVITLSGVGYGEVHDLDRAGMVFSIFLIVFGVGMVGWSLVTMFEVLTSEQLIRERERRRTLKLIKSMNNHFIICGFGRIGRSIIEGLNKNDYSFVIIENDPARGEELRLEGLPYILGDAASDEALSKAGIAKAKALITVAPSDAINTFIILSARWMNPNLKIVARAVNPDSVPKLYRAGATKVISPHILGGWWMAATAINPAATDFIEGLRLAESAHVSLYEFVAGPLVHGRTFGDMEFKRSTGALVVAVRQNEEFIPNPPDNLLLESGAAIIAIGSTQQLAEMSKLLDPRQMQDVEIALSSDAG
jgi:voltage-gated potassium channel